MRRILTSLLTLTLFMSAVTFTACNIQDISTHSETTSGETTLDDDNPSVHGAYGDTFEMFVYDDNRRVLTDDKATISISVILEKENDLSDKTAYSDLGIFSRYSYTVNISGTIDSKYAGKSIMLYLSIMPLGTTWYLDDKVNGIISDTGNFNYSCTITSHKLITEWIPTEVGVVRV